MVKEKDFYTECHRKKDIGDNIIVIVILNTRAFIFRCDYFLIKTSIKSSNHCEFPMEIMLCNVRYSAYWTHWPIVHCRGCDLRTFLLHLPQTFLNHQLMRHRYFIENPVRRWGRGFTLHST